MPEKKAGGDLRRNLSRLAYSSRACQEAYSKERLRERERDRERESMCLQTRLVYLTRACLGAAYSIERD